MRNALLEIREITKDFPGVRALDGVSFSVERGEIHALCGENGAGKTTLIRILAGVWTHGSYAGEIRLDGVPVSFHSIRDAERAGIAVIHQEIALVPEMSVAENLFLGREPLRRCLIDRKRIEEASRRQLVALGLDANPRTPVRELGVGARQLVEIAKALIRNARLLILDEPTAALTESETRTLLDLLRHLRSQGTTILYISHKLDEVFALADRVTVLRDGKSVGTWRLDEVTRQELIRHMVGRELGQLFPRTRSVVRDETLLPSLEVRRWTLLKPTGEVVLDDVSFVVRPGEIVGVAGLMGAGRSELLQSLFGAWEGTVRGTLLLDGKPTSLRDPQDALRHGIALVTEDRKRYGLHLEWSTEKNLTLPSLRRLLRRGVLLRSAERAWANEGVRAFDIRTPSLETPVRNLSGGNQQKVILGKWLLRSPRVLLLDEPTRGIDVGAKAEIHRLMDRLAQEGTAILMVSSEWPEVLGMSDRILVLRRGRLVKTFDDLNGVTQETIFAWAAGGNV